MRRIDRIKLDFSRNWRLPGRERLSNLLKPSSELRSSMKDGIAWCTDENIAIYTSADSYIEWLILSNGTYEDEINKLIRISLKPCDNALDIGSNIGLQSLRMAQCVGIGGNVFSFEPLNYLQEKLRKNISLNRADNVTLFPFALADVNGEIEFTVNPNSWNQGTFSLAQSGNGTEKQMVSVKVADELPEISSLPSLQLVKIDVEGFEYQVMRGLVQTLQKHKPRIIFEYDNNYWVKTGQNIQDCYHFLKEFNYSLYQIGKVGCQLIRHPEKIVDGNIFCIQSDI